MALQVWLSLVGICLLGAMSPGPSLAVVLAATLQHGRRGGYQAALAHGIGVGLYGLLTVTSLALLITRSPALYLAIQLAGAIYLLYLGIGLLRSRGGSIETREDAKPGQNPWLAGFLVAFLNPKLAVFMLALFSQFLRPEFGLPEKAIMVATVGITDACWYALVTRIITQPRLFKRLQQHAAQIDKVFGVVLVLLALTVVLNSAGLLGASV